MKLKYFFNEVRIIFWFISYNKNTENKILLKKKNSPKQT